MNHFRAIRSGSVTRYHLAAADPAYYAPTPHYIYLPIPENKAPPPALLLEWCLLHEIFHAAVRPLLLMGDSRFGDSKRIYWRAFAEMLAEGGAYAVLERCGEAPRRKRLSILQSQVIQNEMYLRSFIVMKQLGVEKLGELLSPLFTIARRLDSVLKESERSKKMTPKQARGVLTKKYQYKKRVRGMDRNDLRRTLHRHTARRMEAILREVDALDIHRILTGAASRADASSREQLLLTELAEIFSSRSEEAWLASGITELPAHMRTAVAEGEA